jgi:hypothetical protein
MCKSDMLYLSVIWPCFMSCNDFFHFAAEGKIHVKQESDGRKVKGGRSPKDLPEGT